MRKAILTTLLGALTLLLALPALAQTPEVEIIDVTVSRYPQVQLVVDFRNVDQLDQTLLTVTEDGVPVQGWEIEAISESVVPVGIVLVIDVSGSMDGAPIEAAKAAAVSFVEQKRSQDFIALVTFGNGVEVLAGFTNRAADLLPRIEGIAAGGETALYDGVIAGTDLYSGSAATLTQRNLILLTDGNDTVSTATLDEARAALQAREARLFGVALESPDFNEEPVQQLVTATNGLYLSTPDPSELSSLYGQINRELENKLVVRFNASQDQEADVAFGVSYQGLTAAQTVRVPGFIKAKPPASTTTVTFAEAESYQVESRAPADPVTLRALAAGAGGLALALFVFILFGVRSEDSASAFRNRLQAYGGAMRESAAHASKGIMGRIPLLRRFTEQAEAVAKERGLLNALNAVLEQANIPLRAGEAIAAAFGLSALVGLVVGLVTASVTAGMVAFGVGILLVIQFIQYAGKREKRRFERQLPDTLTLISTSLRAGYSLLQAVEAVVAEAPTPTSREFGRAIAESRLGRPVVQALQGISDRMRSADFQWAVMAIEIQREVGGNLAEVLQTVAETMLQRNRLRGEIKALTAEGRISAIVLAALPFLLFAFLFMANRSYLQPLITRTVGWIALGVGGLLMLAGVIWLQKIVDIEV